jgi:hypothetical protein
LRRFVVELSDNMLVKLVGNAIVREHDSKDGDELFDEFRMEVAGLINFRSPRSGNSDWWAHREISFPFKNEVVVLGRETSQKQPPACHTARVFVN